MQDSEVFASGRFYTKLIFNISYIIFSRSSNSNSILYQSFGFIDSGIIYYLSLDREEMKNLFNIINRSFCFVYLFF